MFAPGSAMHRHLQLNMHFVRLRNISLCSAKQVNKTEGENTHCVSSPAWEKYFILCCKDKEYRRSKSSAVCDHPIEAH